MFCLQVEPCDDTRGNDVSHILHYGNDIVTDSGVTAVKKVNYLMSYHVVILVAFRNIINVTVSQVRKHMGVVQRKELRLCHNHYYHALLWDQSRLRSAPFHREIRPLSKTAVGPRNHLRFLGLTAVFVQIGILIGSAVFVHLTVKCPYVLLWPAIPPPQINSSWVTGPPSNTWFLWVHPSHHPNGISIGSAVFAALTNVTTNTNNATPCVAIVQYR